MLEIKVGYKLYNLNLLVDSKYLRACGTDWHSIILIRILIILGLVTNCPKIPSNYSNSSWELAYINYWYSCNLSSIVRLFVDFVYIYIYILCSTLATCSSLILDFYCIFAYARLIIVLSSLLLYYFILVLNNWLTWVRNIYLSLFDSLDIAYSNTINRISSCSSNFMPLNLLIYFSSILLMSFLLSMSSLWSFS